MDEGTSVALALVLFGWAILSMRLARFNLTGPLVLLGAGFVLGNPSWGIVTVDVDSSTVHHLAEITLGLLLFADASTVRLTDASHDLRTTSRLLGVGLPLSIVAGTALGVVVFPDLPVALAGVISASLAPTDAALSASVIADTRLAVRVRRVLNVESGMNDGIATPSSPSASPPPPPHSGSPPTSSKTDSEPSGSWRWGRSSVPRSLSSAGTSCTSPTRAAGPRRARGGWRRWRWHSSPSSSPRRSAATPSSPPSSAG